MSRKMEFMLDSGAYSAYTKGVTIDIDDYCDFIVKHKDVIDHYIVLDVIGDAEKTLEAQKYMESKGLMPLPAFHQGSDFKYLDYYVENYDYICISPSPLAYSAGGSKMVNWLDKCFADHVCDENGYPKCKVHGLGLTTVSMLLRYPWYSVDSAAWVLVSSFGGILVPHVKNGEWDFTQSPYKFSISNNKITKNNTDHYDNLSLEQKVLVDKWIKEMGFALGVSTFDDEDNETVIEEGLTNDYKYREALNALFFVKLNDSMAPYPTQFKAERTKGFFV